MMVDSERLKMFADLAKHSDILPSLRSLSSKLSRSDRNG
jgi:hypothetical protein